MRILNSSFLALAALLFLATPHAHAASDVNESYVVSNRDQLGISRAFDDGVNTVIVFADLDTQKPVVTDKAGKKLSAKRVGDYLVLPGIFDEVRVREGDQQGVIKVAVATAPLPSTPTVTAAVTPASAVAASSPGSSTTADAPPSPYKPGSAVYPIPFVKPTSSSVPSTQGTQSNPSTVSGASNADKATAVASSLPTNTASSAAVPGQIPAAPPPAPKAAPQQTWTLHQGLPIGKQLAAWAKQAGWHVVWNYPIDIVAPSDWTSHDDFPTAAAAVINTLADNGALIHYHAFDGNNTFLVFGAGARKQ